MTEPVFSDRDEPYEPEPWSGEASTEAPTEDSVEQATPTDPAELPVEVLADPEVTEWDALEQARVVELDEDY
jgi:hypothetical protein